MKELIHNSFKKQLSLLIVSVPHEKDADEYIELENRSRYFIVSEKYRYGYFNITQNKILSQKRRDKEDSFILINGTISWEENTNLKIYAPSTGTHNLMEKGKPTVKNHYTDSGWFENPGPPIERSSGLNINRGKLKINNIIN